MATHRFGIGIIGLGSIGNRMLSHAARHARVRPACVFDIESGRMRRAQAAHPGLRCVSSAQALVCDESVDLVYVASPPLEHARHVHAAMDAGKAVLCEKPLGVDLRVSEELVDRARQSNVTNAVNLIYASAQPAVEMQQALRSGELGAPRLVHIHLQRRDWARRRYAEAPWLALRAQGGFVREVLTHYVFLVERLLGPARLVYANARYPDDEGSAVTQLIAELDCNGVPVYVHGSTLGTAPDASELTLLGERRTFCTYDLYRLRVSDGHDWSEASVDGDPAADWYRRQLRNVASMLSGESHSMPSFADALSVQRLIEAMH